MLTPSFTSAELLVAAAGATIKQASRVLAATRSFPARTREQWLQAYVAHLRPLFTAIDMPVPAHVRVSVGWPSSRALGQSKRHVGECWKPGASADGHTEIFISPFLADAPTVGHVLVHELIHACGIFDHGPKFRAAALALGLEGKMTATTAGPKLMGKLALIADKLGDFPHGSLDASKSGKKKQGTRMIKCECEGCGYTVRTTAKWLEIGLPGCPSCEQPMPAENGEGEE